MRARVNISQPIYTYSKPLDVYLFYKLVEIELSTHEINGLSENDFILAAKIDLLK